jgi:glucose-1-phosphate cytidylyltransferase
VTIDLQKNNMDIHHSKAEPWKITLVDTGGNTMTGGRVKRVQDYIGDETFMLTYGDGVGDIDIKKLLEFHRSKKKYATVTSVQPSGRFRLVGPMIRKTLCHSRKTKGDGSWINGGFFVLEPSVFDYIKADETIWEKEPLEGMARDGQLMAFTHAGFWQPMDTLRDKNHLEQLWITGKAPWKVWD